MSDSVTRVRPRPAFAGSPRSRRRRVTNRLMEALATAAAWSAVAVLVLVVASVAVKGAGGLSLDLITKDPAPFGQTGGGIADSIVGTIILVALASVIAVPLGILIGIFASQFAPPAVASGIRFALDILNGVPTIITGIFVFALLVGGHTQSGWAGGIALAIVMLPIVARAADEVLLLFPGSLKEAALALGLKRWRIVLRIVVPTAAGGLITAAMLGVARIAGETAPLLFTTSIFSNLGISTSLSQALPNIPVTIFTLSESPSPADHQQAWAAALLLIFMVLALSVIARTAYERTRRGLGGPGL
jgi:phosphate transport system permease protein